MTNNVGGDLLVDVEATKVHLKETIKYFERSPLNERYNIELLKEDLHLLGN